MIDSQRLMSQKVRGNSIFKLDDVRMRAKQVPTKKSVSWIREDKGRNTKKEVLGCLLTS